MFFNISFVPHILAKHFDIKLKLKTINFGYLSYQRNSLIDKFTKLFQLTKFCKTK